MTAIPCPARGLPLPHRTLAEVAVCEKLIVKLKSDALTFSEQGRLRDLLAKAPNCEHYPLAPRDHDGDIRA